jgi:phosphatidylinositol-3-phosphatase
MTIARVRTTLVFTLLLGCAAANDTAGDSGSSTAAADSGTGSATVLPTSTASSTLGDSGSDGPATLTASSADSSGSNSDPGTDSADTTTDGATQSGRCDPACEDPFVCTDAGYCASATGVPQFDHVYVVIFENRSLDSVMGHAPYLDGLAASGAYATAYNSITHPSLPNYIAMTSGDTWGIACDCHPGPTADCNGLSCNLILSSCDCPNDVEHLGDQLDVIGVSWREYGESMGSPCNITDSSGDHYAAKHLPFLYYTNVLGDEARCTERVRDYGDFAADLAAGSYRFSMISPNLCSDMHDNCGGDPVTHGDDWASTNLAPILATPGFMPGGRDVLFVVWDEQDGSIGSAPIPFIVVSPLVEPGTTTAAVFDHYSLLATWEDSYGVPRLAQAASATPIADIWR